MPKELEEKLDRLIRQLSEQERAVELASLQQSLLEKVDQIETLLWALHQVAA